MDIAKIDKNFKIETKIDRPNIRFLSVLSAPFRIYGAFYEDGKFRRIPEAVAKIVNDGVYHLHANAAGARVRFKTDSPYVSVSVKYGSIGKMSHFPLTGSAGFDLYVDGEYYKTFAPPYNVSDGYEGVVDLGKEKMRDITINFPLYSEVRELYIGLSDEAEIAEPKPYTIESPIVYYGSSITQGGCASRPGNAYQGFVSRALDADFVNLGFSGSARGEETIANYIKGLEMSIFIYDYDHNAPNVEHLRKTHEPMFKKIREANPTLPIVIMSRPKVVLDSKEKDYLEVIKATYKNAILSGDKNVYFIEGKELMALCGDEGTVDGCHPTDFGFFSMSAALIPVLKGIFDLK